MVERPVKGIREGWGRLVHVPMSAQASLLLCLVIAGLQRGRQKHQSRDRWLCLSHPSLEGIQRAGWLNSSVGTLSLPAASIPYSSRGRRVFSHGHLFLPSSHCSPRSPSPFHCMSFVLFIVVVSLFPPFLPSLHSLTTTFFLSIDHNNGHSTNDAHPAFSPLVSLQNWSRVGIVCWMMQLHVN